MVFTIFLGCLQYSSVISMCLPFSLFYLIFFFVFSLKSTIAHVHFFLTDDRSKYFPSEYDRFPTPAAGGPYSAPSLTPGYMHIVPFVSSCIISVSYNTSDTGTSELPMYR